MDHRVDGLLLKYAVQKGFVPNIALIKLGRRIDGLLKAGFQVVHHHHLGPAFYQGCYRMGANIAGAAGYQNAFVAHRSILLQKIAAHRPDI